MCSFPLTAIAVNFGVPSMVVESDEFEPVEILLIGRSADKTEIPQG